MSDEVESSVKAKIDEAISEANGVKWVQHISAHINPYAPQLKS